MASLNVFTGAPYSENFYQLRRSTQSLPVTKDMGRLLSTVQQNQVVIMVAETGSGKAHP